MTKSFWFLVAGMAMLVLAVAWQQRSIDRLQAALERSAADITVPVATPKAAVLHRAERAPAPAPVRTYPAKSEPVRTLSVDEGLTDRVAALEQSVAFLSMGAEHLMDRGEIPPSDAKAAEWRTTLLNANLPTNDRISALRMLRRNGLFDDTAARTAANWLLSSTDSNEQRSLLENLRGVDNAALKQVTLDLASRSEDTRVRERAISNLREYGEDPQVEATLWRMLASDESRDVQGRIVDTLSRFPMNETRASKLRSEALDPYAPIEKRVASMRILQSGRQDISDIALPLAQAATQAADSQTQLQYIRAFDDVNHPEFMVPLVNAVQNEDPGIRLRAADALVDYRNDPIIKEWLVHLAKNDPDPEVRQEAARVYSRNGQRGR